MKTAISEQQTAFYGKNGFIEFEIKAPLIPHFPERDLWRKNPDLQTFLTRKLAPLALALTGKKQLRLGCDQWFSAQELPSKAGPIKELLSIQGLAIGAILAENPKQPPKRSPLGLLPLPSEANHVLFFKPEFILDWPHLQSDVYIVIFTLPTAVYAHNPNDPFTSGLKQFGYNFGDPLKNEFHPLLLQP